jgi:peptide/nickel transport system ATP-binding protein
MAREPLLRVEDLRVHFDTPDGVVRAVDGVSYELERGRVLGIVGESGSGKTVASLAIMGLLGGERSHVSGHVLLGGRDLLALGDEQMRAIRGNEIAMVFQDPLSALHPFHRVGAQLGEAIRAHRDVSRREARTRTVRLLETVGIPDACRRADSYPHELSGGMRQRAMIAMALANEPAVLVADEPTTALDATVQAQILDLLARLKDDLGMAVVIITHDLGIVAEAAEEVAVMYAGRIVERGPVERIFAAPEHPYTWGLLRSVPRLDTPRDEDLVPIPGRPPSLAGLPDGCAFAPRCPYVRPRHREQQPPLRPVPGVPGHAVACLLAPGERRRLWAALRSGRSPQQARAEVIDGGGR